MPRKPFKVTTVPLSDSNLIEASAGTGKTYSIAILVIRLILEKKLSVKEILMVTFTKAAVAELEERIRLFVREAYRASKGEEINDETISKIVGNYGDNAEAQRLLKEAVLFLDETSVLTIHSFCQKTLNEFAFETNQLFGAETIKDTTAIIEDEVNKFWRKNITTLSPELLKPLIFDGHLSKKNLQVAITQYLAGKRFFSFDEKINFSLDEKCQSSFMQELKELKEEEDQLNKALFNYIQNNSAKLKAACANDSNACKYILPLIDSPHDLIKYIRQKRASKYVAKLFFGIIDQCDDCDKAKEKVIIKLSQIINHIICYAIQETLRGIKGYKHLNNQISFDDMITKVHESLMKGDSSRLISELQKKYKSVFVDEFQDTDRLQYEIFQKAFGENTILFYIGDPKQSIYAFRKADIFTYFKAYDEVKNIYEMSENFRSSEKMIAAMNSFFLPKPDFDTFYFNHSEKAITYSTVKFPAHKRGLMMKGKDEIIPIKITPLQNKESIANAVTAEVVDLLINPDYSIPDKEGHPRKILPSDIGILVRIGKEGRAIKAKLSQYGVPSVTVSDEKVLHSEEAKSLLYLLQAIAGPTGAKVNKGLLSPFTGFTAADILKLNDERVIELFKKYKARWEEHSIYTALTDFIADFNVQSVLLKDHTENGERIITNLIHLAELLHKIQTNKNLSPLELISWLKRGMEGMELEGDEYLQRIENDEDAVKITTIHSSKGLEYPIVIAPFLDMLVKIPKRNEDPIQSFRVPDTGEYVSMRWSSMNDEQKRWYHEQEEQGNRRLVYVAITRAVYKCSIYKNKNTRPPYDYNNSSIAPFVNAVESSNPLIQFQDAVIVNDDTQYRQDTIWQAPHELQNVSFKLTHESWIKMSYTMLAARHELIPKGYSTRRDNEYDDFVFRQLKKGAVTGNMLHEIFESIHFNDFANRHYIIDKAISRFAPQQEKLLQQMIPRMIESVLNIPIQVDKRTLQLCGIAHEKRIHEFEFDFPVDPFSVGQLEELSNEQIHINVKSEGELEGIMNGKMDLFFEYDGKYYILDWKSNYLGDTLKDYSPAALSDAMNDNNYHLQYFIYTVALKKYLESRLENFDYDRDFGGVIYVFLRGIRPNSNTGVFTTKPAVEKIIALEQMMQKKIEKPIVFEKTAMG